MNAVAAFIAAIAIWTGSTTGANHRVRITLEPNPANRFVCLYLQQIQGGAQSRTSCWEVVGEKEAKTTWKFVKDLDSGIWTLNAVVLQNDERTHTSNEIQIHVLGPNYSPPGE